MVAVKLIPVVVGRAPALAAAAAPRIFIDVRPGGALHGLLRFPSGQHALPAALSVEEVFVRCARPSGMCLMQHTPCHAQSGVVVGQV
jgi:hypothetical protein